MASALPVLIVGAGPAGLATAAELTRRRIPFRLFERGTSLGASWVNAYASLRLHTGKHMSALPGLRYPKGTPLFPSRDEFVSYLNAYAEHFQLGVELDSAVEALTREDDRWVARVNGNRIEGRAVVMACGIMCNPARPTFEGEETFPGTISHSVRYRNPDPYRGTRVLVVGVGNSGGEIASELGAAGADVTILVRRGANVVPRTLAGVPIQYLAVGLRRLPRSIRTRVASLVQRVSARRHGPAVLPRPPWTPLDAIPLIGFHLVEAIRAGVVRLQLGTIRHFDQSTVVFSDGTRDSFDHVILATGFRPALEPLGNLIRRDERGFPMRTDNVTSADQPDLWYVGMRYDSTGAIANINADARMVARRLASRSIRDRLG
ncbi:MAG TPA: NAD(P)/FAD-dependent oxidoreductase [Gemmatimonadaceae bacterium]